ncbi:hypothetical protein T8A63_15130 [Sulfitobacter sp. OXR-159]|uniref:hypothetical protein n=1 Tax=Sulfitobacter sp. OXR-159 TaxID=3100174 RepID=UPI002AC8CF11|nr:hypothetical protein [Sulfitobacter sp. OXR-159]WPZ28948.1 hypothetical protein T8A63_15130 [Sulfitobacter sp. OXR-159]
MSINAVMWALKQDRLSPLDQLALIKLADISQPHAPIKCTYGRIAGMCGVSQNTAFNSVKRLQAAGKLTKSRRARGVTISLCAPVSSAPEPRVREVAR